jgi:flagellar basal-body rod protein FlgB
VNRVFLSFGCSRNENPEVCAAGGPSRAVFIAKLFCRDADILGSRNYPDAFKKGVRMLGSTGSFAKTQFLLERGMDAALVRRAVISDNIANVDTPHFKRSDVTFESQMQRALRSEEQGPYPAKLTQKKHIPFHETIDYRGVRAKIQTEHLSNFRNDKNNVDIEKEIVDATKNTMMYNAMVQRLNKNYKMVGMLLR